MKLKVTPVEEKFLRSIVSPLTKPSSNVPAYEEAPTLVPKDAKLSTINLLLPAKFTWVFVPVAAANSSVPPV